MMDSFKNAQTTYPTGKDIGVCVYCKAPDRKWENTPGVLNSWVLKNPDGTVHDCEERKRWHRKC